MLDRGCISLNNFCDLNCRYCYFYNREDILTNNIDCFKLQEVKEVILNINDYCSKHGIIFKLGLVGAGEPLLSYKLILNLLEWIKTNNLNKHIVLYTISNGFNTEKSLLENLYKYKDILDLSFSLDGYRELHNYARVKLINGQYHGTFDKVFKTIEQYEEIYKEKPSINITVHRRTIENPNKLMDFLIKNNFKKVTFSRLFDCNLKDLAISEYEFNDFIERCSILNKGHDIEIRNMAVKGKKIDCSKYGAKCGAGTTNIFFADGKVYPCGRFLNNNKYIVGNYNTKLEDIESKLHKTCDTSKVKTCYYDEIVLGGAVG